LSSELLIADAWLSDRLGYPAYRLGVPDDIPPSRIEGCARDELSRLPGTRFFAFSRIPCDRADLAAALGGLGFYVVDTSVRFMKRCEGAGSVRDGRCRFAAEEDEEAVAELAGKSIECSRFHLDPAFPREIADAIKAEWARGYFRGVRGDHMIVAEVDGRIVGFCQMLDGESGLLTIDLIAVGAEHRRQGIGRAMCSFAESEIAGAMEIQAGTQLANGPSVRFYQGMGYRLEGATYVFHLHGGGRLT
jgi:ribosomal protein S18 acetylase RimI-like enzyme